MKELHSVEAEEALLGSLLIEPHRLRDVRYYLEADDFFVRRNGWVYEAVCALADDGTGVDPVTLADRLEQEGRLEELGGTARLLALLNAVPSALHCEDYARIVARRSIDRKLKDAAEGIAQLAYKSQPVEEKILAAQEALNALDIISGRPEAMNAEQARRVLGQLADEYSADPLPDHGVRGFSTGWLDLDKYLRGLKAGLYLIGGVTHVGKTAFSTGLAINVAEQGGRVLIIETEDTHETMWGRIYSVQSGLDLDDVERGLSDEDLAWYHDVMSRCADWELAVIARSTSVPQIALEAKSRRLDLLVVDNLETPALQYPGEREWQRFRQAAYGLLTVAQENEIPVVTTMQVSRHQLARRKYKVPQLSDLYGADGPAQAASVVLTLHREDVWKRPGAEPTGELLVSCFKDKLANRAAGEAVTLQFGDNGEIRNLSMQPSQPPPLEF